MHLVDTGKWRRIAFRIAIAYGVYKVFVKRWLDRRPTLVHQTNSKIARLIREHCNTTLSQYIPTLYLVSGIVQTISGESQGSESKNADSLELKRDVLSIPNSTRPPGMWCCPEVIPNGIISVDWISLRNHPEPPPDAPVMILVPGLTGDSSAKYIRTVASYLYRHGIRCVCFNPRGRGDNPVDQPLLYSAGYTQDLRAAVEYVRSQVPDSAPLFATGFSLGSNYLAKYVGEEADDCVLRGAICCAAPVDCLSMSNHLNHSLLGRLMDPFLVALVQRMRKEMEHVLHLHPNIDVAIVREAKTMAEFDHSLIAPMFGFDCVSDYYRYASASMHFWRIRTPVLFVNAWNDPIVPGQYVRMDNFRANSFLVECMTKEGGHSMIWPTGWARESWLARVVQQVVGALGTPHGERVVRTQRVEAREAKPLPGIVPKGMYPSWRVSS